MFSKLKAVWSKEFSFHHHEYQVFMSNMRQLGFLLLASTAMLFVAVCYNNYQQAWENWEQINHHNVVLMGE